MIDTVERGRKQGKTRSIENNDHKYRQISTEISSNMNQWSNMTFGTPRFEYSGRYNSQLRRDVSQSSSQRTAIRQNKPANKRKTAVSPAWGVRW